MIKRICCLWFVVLNALVVFFSCGVKRDVLHEEFKKELNYIPYYLKVYEADSLYIVKDYKSSYRILDSLFREYEPVNMEMYNEVLTYVRLKMILKIQINKNEFSDLISLYGFSEKLFTNDSIFKSYQSQKRVFEDKEYEEFRNIYIKSINLLLREEIKQMGVTDQMYRNNHYKENIDKQDSIDFANQSRLKEIFEEIGFPNSRMIGNFMVDESFVDVNTMLLHTKDSIRMEYFMPRLLQFVKNGSAAPKTYGFMKDQLNLYNGEDQYYGTYRNKTSIPIAVLNKRRKSIGLPSCSYEEWRFEKLYSNEKY